MGHTFEKMLTVLFVASELLDVNAPLLTVYSDHLSLSSLEFATQNHDFVVLSDGDGADLSV
jgi:hypothetical protein